MARTPIQPPTIAATGGGRLPRVDPAAVGGLQARAQARIGGGLREAAAGAERAGTAAASAQQAAARGALAIGEATSEIFGTISDVMLEFNDRKVKAERATALVAANDGAAQELSALQTELARDPDYTNAGARWQAGVAKIRERYSADIHRLDVTAFNRQFGQLAHAKAVEVDGTAYGKLKDASRATLDATLAEASRMAAASASDAERQAHIDRGVDAIALSLRTGMIDRQDALKRRAALLSETQEAEARGLISLDAASAVEQLLAGDRFDRLDPVRRARLTDTALARFNSELAQQAREAEKAERAAERQWDKSADEIYTEALDLDADGALTESWLEDRRLDLKPGHYSSLRVLLDDGGPKHDDPDTYAALERDLLTDPVAAQRNAFTAFGNHLITKETLRSVARASREAIERVTPDQPWQRARDYVATALRANEFDYQPAQLQRLADALREVDDMRLRYPDADHQAALAHADRIVRERQVIEVRQMSIALPLRDWMVGSRAEVDIAASKARLEQRRQAGEIDDAQYRQGAGELRRWYELQLRRAEAAEPPRKR